jgi:hypothetical protein
MRKNLVLNEKVARSPLRGGWSKGQITLVSWMCVLYVQIDNSLSQYNVFSTSKDFFFMRRSAIFHTDLAE